MHVRIRIKGGAIPAMPSLPKWPVKRQIKFVEYCQNAGNAISEAQISKIPGPTTQLGCLWQVAPQKIISGSASFRIYVYNSNNEITIDVLCVDSTRSSKRK